MRNMSDLISREDDDLVIHVNDHAFYTTYDPLFYEIFCVIQPVATRLILGHAPKKRPVTIQH